MKTSEVLTQAKQYLSPCYEPGEQSRDTFICVALVIADEAKKITRDDSLKAQLMIHHRLEGHYTFESWLRNKHNISIHNCSGPELGLRAFRDKMQATRHAWVDSMIQEFAALGD